MSRYLKADMIGCPCGYCEGYDECQKEVDEAPSIDICFCHECKWENTQKCPPHRMGLIHDASDYCSYGIRKTDGADKHDEAVEALGYLIKRMNGADDE